MARSDEPVARVVLTVPTLPPRVLGPHAQPADYLEADASVGPGSPCAVVRAEVEGGRIDSHFVVLGERRPDGREVQDVWLSPDGGRAHFRVRPSWGRGDPGPGLVRVTFATPDGREVVATAPFQTTPAWTLRLPSGATTSEPSFYSGPSGPTRELHVTGPGLRVGLRHWDPVRQPDGLRSTWQPLSFEVWLDDAGQGSVPPRVSVGAGRVHVSSWDRGLRCALVTFDPRDEAGRVQAGRHPVQIAWATRSVAVGVVVGADGTSELVPSS